MNRALRFMLLGLAVVVVLVAVGCGDRRGDAQVNALVARKYAKLAKVNRVDVDCDYIQEWSSDEAETWLCDVDADRPSPYLDADFCTVYVRRFPKKITAEIDWDAREQTR